jgi:hypothetical protein
MPGHPEQTARTGACIARSRPKPHVRRRRPLNSSKSASTSSVTTSPPNGRTSHLDRSGRRRSIHRRRARIPRLSRRSSIPGI